MTKSRAEAMARGASNPGHLRWPSHGSNKGRRSVDLKLKVQHRPIKNRNSLHLERKEFDSAYFFARIAARGLRPRS